jgi:hypothetical protein
MPGLRPILYQEGNLSVALTRNKIVNLFLDTECDYLVMVDDDVVPPPESLTYLPELLEANDDYGMIAVPHVMPLPGQPGRLILTAFGDVEDLVKGLNEVDLVATGCVGISRAALVALGENPFWIENDPTATIQSDDFLFCKDLHEAGFKIGAWYDGWYCDHLTTVSLAPLYEASMLERSMR